MMLLSQAALILHAKAEGADVRLGAVSTDTRTIRPGEIVVIDHNHAKAEGEAKKTLDMLAHWEAGHERLFKSMHDKALQEYSGMPGGG